MLYCWNASVIYVTHVSILIQPEGWMLFEYFVVSKWPDVVSILIQPEGWMLCAMNKVLLESGQFQSSSSPKAGCYW